MNVFKIFRSKIKLIDIAYWITAITTPLFINISRANAASFKTGFENLTNNYLLPLSGAVAGCAFITFIILSYFKQDEYQKKVAGVLALTLISTGGLGIIQTLIESFS